MGDGAEYVSAVRRRLAPSASAEWQGRTGRVMIRQSAEPRRCGSPLADEHADRRATCAPGSFGCRHSWCTVGSTTASASGTALPGRAHPRCATSRAPQLGPCRVRARPQAVHGAIEQFLAQAWESRVTAAVEPDRVLATVLFIGHRRLDRERERRSATLVGASSCRSLQAVVRRQLARYRGSVIDIAGDGVLRDVRRAGACDPLRLRHQRGCTRARARGSRRPSHGRVRHASTEGRRDRRAHRRARRRLEPHPGEVLVTSTVSDLVAGSGIAVRERGEPSSRACPTTWRSTRSSRLTP